MHRNGTYLVWTGSILAAVLLSTLGWNLHNHTARRTTKVMAANTTNSSTQRETGSKASSPLSHLSASATSPTQVKLTWSVSGKVDGRYFIYRAQQSTQFSQASQIGSTNKTSYTDSDAKPNNQYVYWVLPKNSVTPTGQDNESVQVRTLPSPVRDVKESGPLVTSVTLSWKSSGNGVTYDIYRGETLAAATKVGSVNSTTYTDTGLSPVTEYTYWIVSRNAAGKTDPDEGIRVITQPAIPAPETHLTVAALTSQGVPITWEKMQYATDYAIFRFVTEANGTVRKQRIAVVKTNTYTDTHITPNHTYTYVVVPFNSGITGTYPPTLLAQVTVPSPTSKGHVTVQPITHSALADSVNWDALNP